MESAIETVDGVSIPARIVMEVSPTALQSNFTTLAEKAAPCNLMCVVKANGYGLGQRAVSKILHEAGCRWFGVSRLNEAVPILNMGVPVSVVGSLIPEEIPIAVQLGPPLVITIGSVDFARAVDAVAHEAGKVVTCHLNVDSGMGRLGFLLEDAEEEISRVAKFSNLRITGIMTHFPDSSGDLDHAKLQVFAFLRLLDKLSARGITFEHIHAANTGGIMNLDMVTEPPFTMARSGIGLWGTIDYGDPCPCHLKEVVRLKSRVVSIRTLKRGQAVSYNRLFKLAHDTRIATVCIGYADGLPMGLTNNGCVHIRGHRCPIRGRITMDYIMVSLEEAPDAVVGDEVVLIGEGVTIADWAKAKGSITYDVLCSIGHRVARVYV